MIDPTRRVHRLEREQERDETGADADGGAEPTEADRAHAEPVLGDRGEERDRAAEQDRDEVERDRAEQHRFAAHEAQALHRVAQTLAAGCASTTTPSAGSPTATGPSSVSTASALTGSGASR